MVASWQRRKKESNRISIAGNRNQATHSEDCNQATAREYVTHWDLAGGTVICYLYILAVVFSFFLVTSYKRQIYSISNPNPVSSH
jgi:hypothetical protein